MAELYPLPNVISPFSPTGGSPARVERDAQRAAPPPPPAQAAPLPTNQSSSTTEYRGNNLNIEA